MTYLLQNEKCIFSDLFNATLPVDLSPFIGNHEDFHGWSNPKANMSTVSLWITSWCPQPSRLSQHDVGTVQVKVYGSALEKLFAFRPAQMLKLEAVLQHQFGTESVALSTDAMEADYRCGGLVSFKQTLKIVSPHGFMDQRKGVIGDITIELLEVGEESSVPPTHSELTDTQLKNKALLEQQKYANFALVARNGVKIPCHVAFLGQSFGLDRLLQNAWTGRKEGKTRLSEEGVWSLLRYLYYGDLSAARKSLIMAIELLEAALEYDIHHLETVTRRIFLETPDEAISVDFAVELFARNAWNIKFAFLRDEAIRLIKLKKSELESCRAFEELLTKDKELVKKLFALAV